MKAEMSSLRRPSNEKACSPPGAGALVVTSTVLLLFTLSDGVNGFSPPLTSKMAPYNCKRSALSGRYSLKAQRKHGVPLAATSVKDADSKDASKNVVRIYKDYATRLWNETNPLARERIAQDKAAAAVKQVEHIMIGEEYVPFSEESEEARQQLLVACQNMLKVMDDKSPTDDKTVVLESTNETSIVLEEATIDEKAPAKAKKSRRSILFGAAMGAIVACWVFSGNYIFTGLFTLMTILGQLEYYRMVMNTGIYPARRISIVGASSMFLTVSLCCATFP